MRKLKEHEADAKMSADEMARLQEVVRERAKKLADDPTLNLFKAVRDVGLAPKPRTAKTAKQTRRDQRRAARRQHAMRLAAEQSDAKIARANLHPRHLRNNNEQRTG